MTTLNRNRWKQNIDILKIKREMISKWKLLPVLVLKSFIQIQAIWVIVSIQKSLLMDSASEKKFMLSNFLHNTLYTQNALLWTNMQIIYSKQVALGSTLCTTTLLYPSPGVHILLYTYLIEIYTFGRFIFFSALEMKPQIFRTTQQLCRFGWRGVSCHLYYNYRWNSFKFWALVGTHAYKVVRFFYTRDIRLYAHLREPVTLSIHSADVVWLFQLRFDSTLLWYLTLHNSQLLFKIIKRTIFTVDYSKLHRRRFDSRFARHWSR